jgi:type IV secretion system protein VirD4
MPLRSLLSAPRADTLEFKKTRAGEPVHPYLFAAIGAAGILGGMTAATQYIADRLAYHRNLGPGLYARDAVPGGILLAGAALALILAVALARTTVGRPACPALIVVALLVYAASRGPIYAPTRGVQWAFAYKAATEQRPDVWARLKPVFVEAQIPAAGGMLLTAAALATLVLAGSTRTASNAHGTAEFGSGAEFLLSRQEEDRRQRRRRASKPVVEPGVMIGRHRNGRLLWYRGPSHILTMAPTRSGKGVGAVVPTLLRYPGSVVCMDIKGENFAVTWKQRIADGGEVFVLDPFRITGDHTYHAYANPFDIIDTRGKRADRALDDCKSLAEMLVEESGKENKHFTEEGRSWLATMMLHVCHAFHGKPAERTLMKVRELMTLPEEPFAELMDTMALSDHPLVRRGVARLLQKEERERTGVISTAQAGIDFLDSVPMAGVLVPPPAEAEASAQEGEAKHAANQIDLSLIKGEIPMTIYLVIPPEALKTHAAWIRMMIACINNMITRIPGRPTHRILMLLDEFAQLGYIRPVLEGISLVGGYGVLFWIIIQDLAQLKGRYRDNWETIFANCDVKQCFGTNDYTTAELLSKMAGETTVYTESGSSGKGRSFGRSSGRSTNYGESVSEKGRRLLFADELMKLRTWLVFVKGSQPMLLRPINYLSDPEFQGMYQPNPMYN